MLYEWFKSLTDYYLIIAIDFAVRDIKPVQVGPVEKEERSLRWSSGCPK